MMGNMKLGSVITLAFILISGCSSETTDTSNQGDSVTSTAGINYPECSKYTPYDQFNDDFTNRMLLYFVTPGSKTQASQLLINSQGNPDFLYFDMTGDLSASGCQPVTSVIKTGNERDQKTFTFSNTFNGDQLAKQKSELITYEYTYITGNVSTVGLLDKVTVDGLDCYDFAYDSNMATLTEIQTSTNCGLNGISRKLVIQYADPAGRDPYILTNYDYQDGAWTQTNYAEWTVIREANVIQSIKIVSTNSLNQTFTQTIVPTVKDTNVLENFKSTMVFNGNTSEWAVDFIYETNKQRIIDGDEGSVENEVNFGTNQVDSSSWSEIMNLGSSTYTY